MRSLSQNESLESKVAAYAAQLNADNPTAHRGREYLRARALARTDVVGPFRLGVVAEPLPGDEDVLGRLVIPYLTPSGVRGIKYRCLEDHDCKAVDYHAKYDQPKGQEQRLYNVAAYFSGLDYIGVCEGEIDAITATVHLGIPTMAVPGATQWAAKGRFWELTLRDFAVVYAFADGDKAGLELAKAIAADVRGDVQIIKCPPGEDINSMVVSGRADELRRKLG